MGNKPKATIQLEGSPIKMTIWGGQYGDSYNFSKAWKDKEGNWKNTDNFRKAELLTIRHYCDVALRLELPGDKVEEDDGGVV